MSNPKPKQRKLAKPVPEIAPKPEPTGNTQLRIVSGKANAAEQPSPTEGKVRASIKKGKMRAADEPVPKEKPVAVNSIESRVGYSILVRLLEQTYRSYFRFYTSEEGGSCPPELARSMVFGEDLSAEEWRLNFERLMSAPVDTIQYLDLLALNIESPKIAEGMWELIKQEARREFESGHQAAQSLESLTTFDDAWERARYLGVRESFCREWRPRGGIELSMIDSITQAWLQLQHWTTELVRRSRDEPRTENPDFVEWKNSVKREDVKPWQAGFWDLPYVHQEKAIGNAAEMVERFQRMYFRAIRALRDWRRYSPN